MVALSAIVSALVAGAMVHRLQAQRELARAARKNLPASLAAIAAAAAAADRNNAGHQQQPGWLQAYGLFRARCAAERQRAVVESRNCAIEANN